MEHVVVHIGDDGGSNWSGVAPEHALEWTRVFLQLPPVWPGAGCLWMLSQALERGEPAGVTQWAHRARRAGAIGLRPSTYRALSASLDRVPRTEAVSHPDNDLDRSLPNHPTRRFDDALWAPWSALVESGATEDDATRLLLAARDAQLAAMDRS